MYAQTLLFTAFVFLLLTLGGCKQGADAGADPPKSTSERSLIEERLITELSPSADRAGRERNAIINRAIDGNFDVYPAPEGYFYEILDPGNYGFLQPGDLVEAHYTGRFLDGREFDNSHRRNQKLRFRVGDLIPAWNLALPRLKPGGRLRLFAPSALAYGADGLVSGRGDTLVPAHTPLEFLITDLQILEE